MDLEIELVIEGPAARRLDLALLKELRRREAPALSRASLKRLFQEGRILRDGNPAKGASELLPGRYLVVIRGWDPLLAAPERAAESNRGAFLPVLYEDEDLLILHKPTGIPSVPQDPAETETAVGAALARDPRLALVGRGGLEPAILHRLDTGTSGILVFARNEAEYERVHGLWKRHEIRKEYRALARAVAEGPPRDLASLVPPLRLDYPLAHDAKSSKRMIALFPEARERLQRRIRGKELRAVTEILGVRPASGDLLDLHIRIETGVMHQIRCHLSSVGWPILGDPIYRGAPSSRLWLHAWRIELPLRSGARLRLESRLPPGWP